MTRSRTSGLLALVLILPAFGGAALAQEAREKGFRLFRELGPTEHGFARQNWAVAQDARGILFAGNLRGVLEYDGEWWRRISLANGSAVYSLAVLPDQRIAVGGVGEMGYLAPDMTGTLQFHSLVDDLPEPRPDVLEVRRIHVQGTTTWFVSDAAIFRWDGEGRLRVAADLSVFPGIKGSFLVRDTLFVAMPDGLRRLGEGGAMVPVRQPRLATEEVELLLEADQGAMLVGIRSQGLYLWGADERLEPFSPAGSRWARERALTHAARLPDGRIAVASRRGVMFLTGDGELDEIIDASVGLSDEEILFVHGAADGAVWLAGGAIVRIDAGAPVSLFDRRSGLPGTPSSVARRGEDLYIGTSAGLVVLRGDDRSGSLRAEPVAGVDGTVFTLLAVEDDLLAGTRRGAFVERGGRLLQVPGTESLTLYLMKRGRFDPDRVWLGMREGLGLLVRRQGSWEYAGRVEGVPGWVRSIEEVSPGELWLGATFDGPVRARLQEDPVGLAAQVRRYGEKLELDAYVGRLQGRVVVLQGGELLAYDSSVDGLVPDPDLLPLWGVDAFQLVEDPAGNVWMNGDPPLVALREPGGPYRADRRIRLELPCSDIQGLQAESSGIVWITCEAGLFRFDSARVAAFESRPSPLIRRAVEQDQLLFGGGSAPSTPIRLRADRFLRLRLEYTAMTYERSARYQHRLDPIEADWSPWSQEPFTEFTGLREGRYTFRLRTGGSDPGISPVAVLDFEILPPWHRSKWALGAYLVALVGLVTGFARVRTRSLRHRATTLEGEVAQKTAEIQRALEELRGAKLEVDAKNRQLEVANERLEALSLQDPLTGIANRRHLRETLLAECQRADRAGTPVSLVLLDIDLFKDLNDARGHQEGDACLEQIGDLLAQHTRRAGELAARWGGEELAMVLPGSSLEAATQRAETVRTAIESLAIPHPGAPGGVVTASFGVASTLADGVRSPDDLVRAADRALYRAKAEGRNCVRTA